MSPENVTPESVAKLRDDINRIASHGLKGLLSHEDTLSLLDALDSAWRERDALRAEVDTLISNGSTAAFDKISDHFAESERENVALRAEVERLTEEAGSLLALANQICGLVGITDDRPTADAMREAYKRISNLQARRSEAGRVEVPELTEAWMVKFLADTERFSPEDYRSMVRERRLKEVRSRLSPSPQPSADVVAVLQRFVDWCKKYPSSRIYELVTIARKMDEICEAAKIALRSSTNHDSKET